MCPKCGKVIQGRTVRCPECGRDLAVRTAPSILIATRTKPVYPSGELDVPTDSAKQRHRRRVLRWIAALLLIAIMGGAIALAIAAKENPLLFGYRLF